jgi:dienelactone hydrolase
MERGEFKTLLGPLPIRPDTLGVTVEEQVDCGEYVRNLLSYNVEEGETITAYVCIPKGIKEPAPGVICHHQHNGEFDLGKNELVGLAGDPEQAYAAEFAKLGYITLAADALAFGDRNGHPEPFLAEIYEATARISQGTTLMAKLLHDIDISVEVLAALPEVDEDNIGFLGYSYGGKMAFWTAAHNPRIKAAVSHCGSTSLRRCLEKDGGILPAQTIPNFLQHGDVVDVAKLSYAKLFISGTDQDIWSEGIAELQHALSSSPVHVETALFDGEHRFSKEMRGQAYSFLRRWLR